ncbi:hypothetical protein ID866_7745 [Astraeus odoratus]|nr:hypothetical protein ID866_7745 [Astraeus odoratus]
MPATRAAPSFRSGVCHVCGKELSRKADLPRHMLTHASNKEELMIPCPYKGCSYKALQRSNLATHLHTHTGERPNKCRHPGCSYTTSDPGSLTRHRKSVHGYEPKVKKSNSPAEKSREEPRRQRRHSPYSVPSPASNEDSILNDPATLDEPLPELEALLMPCPTDVIYPTVAAKNECPGYDSVLSPRTVSRGDPSISSYADEFSLSHMLLPAAEPIQSLSCPYMLSGIEPEIPRNTAYHMDPFDSWMPISFPSSTYDGTIFVSGMTPVLDNTFQDYPVPFLPLGGVDLPPPHGPSQRSFTGTTAAFSYSEGLHSASFPVPGWSNVGAPQFFPGIYLGH